MPEISKESLNFANGIKDGLRICLNEMLDYIGDVPDDENEDENYYSDYDRETARFVSEIKDNLKKLRI